MGFPALIQCKHLLLVTLLLLFVASASTQTHSTRQDSDFEIKEEQKNATPGFVNNVYNLFSKMKSYVTGHNVDAERRLEDFKKLVLQESRSLNQVLHKLEGNIRYSDGDSSGRSFPISKYDPKLPSRRKREHPVDFILHQDSVENLVLSNVVDNSVLIEREIEKLNIDFFVHDNVLFFVVVNKNHQAWISSFDKKLNEIHIDTLKNVQECKFNKVEAISLLLMICTPPFDYLEISVVQVVKFLKFADGNYYLFSHQKLKLEKPSTTYMWYQNQDNFLMIGQHEKLTYTEQSVYHTDNTMYHWTGSYFQQIEEGGTLPGNSVRSLLHFQASNNHYIAMANFENNKGEHNIFSNIFKYSLSLERYEMWHHIPTKGARHFAAFTLGTGMNTENFLVVANYCEDNDEGTCNPHTNSVIYIITADKFAQFQCIETHGAVQWLAIEVGDGILLAVANSLTGAAFYQYNGWKFVQVDLNTEQPIPALGPGISSITASYWNGNYYMGVTNMADANLSVVYTLEFRVDAYLKKFHSDASKWCFTSVDYMENGPQPKDLIERINEAPWKNSTYTFTNNVTFENSLKIKSDATSHTIYEINEGIRIPRSQMPIIEKQQEIERSLEKEEQILNNSVPLSHSWPDGLHLSKLIVESGSVYNITANSIGGVTMNSNDLILIKSSIPVTAEQLYLEQAHIEGNTTLEYVNEVLWSDLVTLSGNHWLIDGKSFFQNVSAVHLEVEGKFQDISFGHSEILDHTTTNYTGGIICDEILSPEVFANTVANHDMQQLQENMVTNDAPVYTGSLLVNNSVAAKGIVTRELSGQYLEEIFHQALMTNLKDKQTILFDHVVKSASMFNIEVDRVNGLRIPEDVLINSPVLEYSFDSATFTNLEATSLGIGDRLNDIKVINGSLDVLSTKEKEVQVISAFKTFEDLNLSAGMTLRNQTFEHFDFIPENRDDNRKRRSTSVGNSLCPNGVWLKLSLLSSNDKLWHQLLQTVRTTVTSRILLEQLHSASNSMCLSPEEQMVISDLQHNVHCVLNDLTIVDNVHNLFKNTCSSQQEKTFSKERLQKVTVIVDKYRQTLEKKMIKILVNPVGLYIKEEMGSYLGNQLFIVKLILQQLYSNKHLYDMEFSSNRDNNDEFGSQKNMLNSHVWYLLRNINILYKIQMVNTHSIFKLKNDTASRIGKENIDTVINYEMERIVKTLSIIESTNRNLCYLMIDFEKHLNSEERDHIVFMLQMYRNKILALLLDDIQNQKDLYDQEQNEPIDSLLHLYSNDQINGEIEGSKIKGAIIEDQIENVGKVTLDLHSRHKRSTSDLEETDVYILDQQGNQYNLTISKNSTIVIEMLSNSRMVEKFLHRFDFFLSLNNSVNSTEHLDNSKSDALIIKLISYYDSMIKVLEKILSKPNDYILRWGDNEIQQMDGNIEDHASLTKALQYQLPTEAWVKIDYIRSIVPIAKETTNQIQEILSEKIYNIEHSNITENCNNISGSCGSNNPKVIENIEEEFVTFYVLNKNYVKDDTEEYVESSTPNSESKINYEYLQVTLEYLNKVWNLVWCNVYVDDTKEKSIVSSKVREIARETTQILDAMSKENFGYKLLDIEFLKREIDSIELVIEILRFVKVSKDVKTALIYLKHHNGLVKLTTSITEEIHYWKNDSNNSAKGDLVEHGKKRTKDFEAVDKHIDSVEHEKKRTNDHDSVGNRNEHTKDDDKKNKDKHKKEEPKRRRVRSAEPMVDSLKDFTKKAIDFINNFDKNSPMYILNKANVEEPLYYYRVNAILNKKYSNRIPDDLKWKMDMIAERTPDILLKLEVLKNVDKSIDEEALVKSKVFSRIRVPNFTSRQLKEDRKENNIDYTTNSFEWSKNKNVINSKPNSQLSRFKRGENSTEQPVKLNNNSVLIDSVLTRYIENRPVNISEIRKKIQCFMELDNFKNVLLAITILEEHLKRLVIQETNFPSFAKDGDHELHEKIENFINYHAIKILKSFNNVKENFGKALSNINSKMLSNEAENYNCLSEILSAAGYIPCGINSKIKCINSAIADIKQILDDAKLYITEQLSLDSSPYIDSLCSNGTIPIKGSTRLSPETDTSRRSPKNDSSYLLDNENSTNQSHVLIAIYDAEETISYLHMFKKINPLPVLLIPSEVHSSKKSISHLFEVERFLDGIIEGRSRYINDTHFISFYNKTQLPMMFLKLKSAMAILEENPNVYNDGLDILDNIFGNVDKLGKIDKAIIEMEQKKQQYEQVLQEMKLNFPGMDLGEMMTNVAVVQEKVVVPVLHDRFSVISGKIAGHNLKEILSKLYLVNETAYEFMDEFDISNVHNITFSGSLTVNSHINGISPNILNRACFLRKPYNDVTFVFNKPVIIEHNLISYYISSIPFENYATTVGKHVFYKDALLVGGVNFQDNVIVRNKVNDHNIYHSANNIAQKSTPNTFKSNLTFYNIMAENIIVKCAMVQKICLDDIVTLKDTTIITGNKFFSNIKINTNLSVETMTADFIDTKYNTNVEVDKLFQNNFRKNPDYIQVLSGVQVFRNLTFNVDADVSVGIFDYTLNSLSKRAVYKDKSVNLSYNLKTFNNTKIDNLNFYSSFDNVSSLETWMMKNGDQQINSYSSFSNLKAKIVKVNDIRNNEEKVDFDHLVNSAIKIDESSIIRNNILWNLIKVVGGNISVGGLVQGVDISEETVVKDSLDVILGGNKYFKRLVKFDQFLDINGLFNGRDLDLLCSDYYFHNLTVYGDSFIDSRVNATDVTCHSRELPEKNWESCWQADRNHTVKDKLNITNLDMFNGTFTSLSDNISLSTFQNEVLWKNSSELQSIQCVTNFTNITVNALHTKSLTTYKLHNNLANDLYDMLTRNENQNISGFYYLNSVLMIEKLYGPDKLNDVTLDHYCQHSKFCQVYAEKSMQGLYIEDFLKPHIDCVIQGIDISEWWDKAIKPDSSPNKLPNTLFENIKVMEPLQTAGLVDGVEIQNLLLKSTDQTIVAALLLNNTSEDVLLFNQLDIHDGKINEYNLVQLLDRLVFVDMPAFIQGSTRFFNDSYFHDADYSEKLTSLKNAVDWIIKESAVVHLRNEVETLSHLAIFANEALPRQPLKFEGWSIVQQITGMYYRVKALSFDAESNFGNEVINPVYLALLSWYGPTVLLQHNPEKGTYDASGIQIAGNCTTAVSALRNRGVDYIINSNDCDLNTIKKDLQSHPDVQIAFPFGVSLNTSQGFTLIWKMQNKIPELVCLVNTRGSCDHQVMDLQGDFCILFICHQGFDLRLMCLGNDTTLETIQSFKQKYQVFKVSVISHTNTLGRTNTFLAIVDSQGLNLYMYDPKLKFYLLETKHLQQLSYVDLVSHTGDMFISAISSGFRGLERGMIYVYKLDFNHLEMQYNHTSVLLRFISPVSGELSAPKMELFSSIPEDMPIECHFTKLQTGELSLFVTSGSGVITRLSHSGVEGFSRSGDVLVSGSTTLEVWNSYRNGRKFTRLSPSGFPKMQAQETIIMESSYLENTEEYSTCNIREF